MICSNSNASPARANPTFIIHRMIWWPAVILAASVAMGKIELIDFPPENKRFISKISSFSQWFPWNGMELLGAQRNR